MINVASVPQGLMLPARETPVDRARSSAPGLEVQPVLLGHASYIGKKTARN